MSSVLTLLPRRVAFRDPERTCVTLSHDGRRLAWLQSQNGVLNVVVAPVNDVTRTKQITFETSRSVLPVLIWARTGRHVVIFREQQGDENYRAFSVPVETGVEVPLTQGNGVRGLYAGYLVDSPDHLLFSVNARDARYFDLIQVNVVTGGGTSLFENQGFSALYVDRWAVVQFAERVREDGSAEILRRQPDASWTPFLEIPVEDVLTTRWERLSADGRSAFVLDSRGRDKTALVEIDLSSRRETVLAEDAEADISSTIYHPDTDRPLAATAVAARKRWHVVDDTFRSDLEALLRDAGDADVEIVDLSSGARRILVFLNRSDDAGEFRLYGCEGRATALFKDRDDLTDVSLRPMQSVSIVARDGLTLPSYLTLPLDHARRGPLVIAVHGGPYDRDLWGYSAVHQWLASRGYAVLSINFRGSTGFGKAFVNSASQEWGGRMQDDLVDGATWAIRQGYADPTRIGMFGVSYGGYAAQMAAARAPDTFACFVSAFGPSDLASFMAEIPPYWHTWFATIRSRLADPSTPEGAAWLAERSPLTHVDRMVRPMLLVRGLRDARVSAAHSEKLARALRARNVPVTLVTFEDEGHYFTRQENRIAFSAVMEEFLAHHLAGAAEPRSDAFVNSSIRVD